MKKFFILFVVIVFCSCSSNKTVDDIVQNLIVESYSERLFNNGKEEFLYTFIESNGKKITIISNVDKTEAVIISMR